MPQENNYKGLEQKRILIVEDVELNQYLARHIMESWGCVVQIAENGKIALEKMQGNEFDLVLMDIQMPVMDGMEATRQIRLLNDKTKSTIPIVALTANALKGDCSVYIEAGMNDCLPKPFEEPILFETILKNIRQAQSSNPETPAVQDEPLSADAGPQQARYDLSMVEAISGGDHAFILRMLRLFLETVPASLRDIQAASDKKDWLTLSKLAHKIKSTIDSMSIKELKETVRIIETEAKTAKTPEILPALVDKLVVVMGQIMELVKKDHAL